MTKYPLVSVIIPCFNHARYLDKAITSVLKQSYPHSEIIVVDDGSTEDIKSVTDNYSDVIYIRQDNKGLPAARNTGIRKSKGNYLVFLDADDWLYPRALEKNLEHFKKRPDVAFVTGAFEYFYEQTNEYVIAERNTSDNYYIDLLHINHIAMIATVLFNRWVFNEYLFDEALKNCEDYDLYLNVTRKYKVHYHNEVIAVYRKHSTNITVNSFAMLNGALHVLNQQKKYIGNVSEYIALRKGKNNWKIYYGNLIIQEAISSSEKKHKAQLLSFFRRYPFTFFLLSLKFKKGITSIFIKSMISNYLPVFALRLLNRFGFYKRYVPRVHRVKKGDFERLKPFSNIYGYDRGGPIDRYYIENFLKKNENVIQGRVLEIKDNAYTKLFGASRVTASEILDIDEKNPDATIIGDLQHLPFVPDNSFDCIILTQTLHLIYNVDSAIKTCHRILKPGGSLLITAPGIVPVGLDNDYEHWYWSFNVQSMKRLLHNNFPVSKPIIESYGNIFTATAFLYGMGLPEIKRQQLEYNDKHYPVSICALVNKENS